MFTPERSRFLRPAVRPVPQDDPSCGSRGRRGPRRHLQPLHRLHHRHLRGGGGDGGGDAGAGGECGGEVPLAGVGGGGAGGGVRLRRRPQGAGGVRASERRTDEASGWAAVERWTNGVVRGQRKSSGDATNVEAGPSKRPKNKSGARLVEIKRPRPKQTYHKRTAKYNRSTEQNKAVRH